MKKLGQEEALKRSQQGYANVMRATLALKDAETARNEIGAEIIGMQAEWKKAEEELAKTKAEWKKVVDAADARVLKARDEWEKAQARWKKANEAWRKFIGEKP